MNIQFGVTYSCIGERFTHTYWRALMNLEPDVHREAEVVVTLDGKKCRLMVYEDKAVFSDVRNITIARAKDNKILMQASFATIEDVVEGIQLGKLNKILRWAIANW